MGMIVQVYRHADTTWGDSTNGGVSSKVTRLCVLNVEGPFQPSEDCPAVMLDSHYQNCLRLVPVSTAGKWVQFGGNYAACSDSRFSEACKRIGKIDFYGAVAIHDRVEE